jgi:hypothetical protein
MPKKKTYPPVSRRSERLPAGIPHEGSLIEQDLQDFQEIDHVKMDTAIDQEAELHELREEIARLRAERERSHLPDHDHDRSRRSATVGSAFGGTIFQPRGIAALPAFRPFEGPSRTNPLYNYKEKARANDPPKFGGDRTLFDSWVHKLAGKFEEDISTFRTEKSRMLHLMSLLEGPAERSVEARFQSTTRPFSCLAEMIQVLAAAYHDSNQATSARSALHTLRYVPGKVDIHTFIAEFNALATKAEIPDHTWKGNLWDHIPPDLDPRLLHESEDESVSYETFCEHITKAAFSHQRAYELRRQFHRPQTSKPPSRANTLNVPALKNTKTPVTSANLGRALTEDEKRLHWDADTCFSCGKTGHRSAECPVKRDHKMASTEARESDSEKEEL